MVYLDSVSMMIIPEGFMIEMNIQNTIGFFKTFFGLDALETLTSFWMHWPKNPNCRSAWHNEKVDSLDENDWICTLNISSQWKCLTRKTQRRAKATRHIIIIVDCCYGHSTPVRTFDKSSMFTTTTTKFTHRHQNIHKNKSCSKP